MLRFWVCASLSGRRGDCANYDTWRDFRPYIYRDGNSAFADDSARVDRFEDFADFEREKWIVGYGRVGRERDVNASLFFRSLKVLATAGRSSTPFGHFVASSPGTGRIDLPCSTNRRPGA